MTRSFQCGNGGALIGYLYDECTDTERAAMAAHLAECDICREEFAALQDTRAELAVWTPPDAQLGFKVVAESPGEVAAYPPDGAVTTPVRQAWWSRPMPAWAQVAAALVLFSAGLSLGVLRGASGSANAVAGAPAGAGVAASAGGATPVSARDLAELERRLRAELAETHPASAPVSAPQARSEAQLLEQVRALIRESEQRQQRELTLRTAEVVRDFDVQRRGDLSRIERTFGQMEGTTGVQVEQQRQMLDYLMRVSQPQP